MTNLHLLWAIPGLVALGLVTTLSVCWLYNVTKPLKLTKDEIISTALTCMQSDEQQRKVRCQTCQLANICIDKIECQGDK